MRNHCIRAIIQWSKNKKNTSKADSHDLTTVKKYEGESNRDFVTQNVPPRIIFLGVSVQRQCDLSSKAFPEL